MVEMVERYSLSSTSSQGGIGSTVPGRRCLFGSQRREDGERHRLERRSDGVGLVPAAQQLQGGAADASLAGPHAGPRVELGLPRAPGGIELPQRHVLATADESLRGRQLLQLGPWLERAVESGRGV